MQEFKKTEFKFKFDGKEYAVKKPTLKQIEELQRESEDTTSLSKTIGLLSDLGLPKEVAYEMEVDHIVQIVDYVSGAKKK